MKKVASLALLILLFFLALSSEWSLLEIGRKLGENQIVATIIIQGLLIIVAVLLVIFISLNLGIIKKKNEND